MKKLSKDPKEVTGALKDWKRKDARDGMLWKSKFKAKAKCITLEKLAYGNYISVRFKDGIPRYRDEKGMWHRLDYKPYVDKMLLSTGTGEILEDEVGNYIMYKEKHRAYLSFKALEK